MITHTHVSLLPGWDACLVVSQLRDEESVVRPVTHTHTHTQFARHGACANTQRCKLTDPRSSSARVHRRERVYVCVCVCVLRISSSRSPACVRSKALYKGVLYFTVYCLGKRFATYAVVTRSDLNTHTYTHTHTCPCNMLSVLPSHHHVVTHMEMMIPGARVCMCVCVCECVCVPATRVCPRVWRRVCQVKTDTHMQRPSGPHLCVHTHKRTW